MRWHPRGSFERLTAPLSLWQAFVRTQRHKRRQPVMARFALECDREVLALHRALRSGCYRHGPYRIHVLRDPKVRLIAAASVRDRVVHQALVREIAPTFERGFLPEHFAWGEGRGPQRAALRFLALQRRHRFVLMLDIRRYFPSIVHKVLLGLIERRVRDDDTRALLRHVVAVGAAVYRAPLAVAALGLADQPVPPGCGMPIGSYVSQWSGALYLDGLDHFVKRELRVSGYLRYMDDCALFSDDPAALERSRDAIAVWLQVERGLCLNPRRLAVRPCSEAVLFVGMRIDRAGLSPGPKIRRRLRRRVRAAARKGPAALERTLRSYRGLFLL